MGKKIGLGVGLRSVHSKAHEWAETLFGKTGRLKLKAKVCFLVSVPTGLEFWLLDRDTLRAILFINNGELPKLSCLVDESFPVVVGEAGLNVGENAESEYLLVELHADALLLKKVLLVWLLQGEFWSVFSFRLLASSFSKRSSCNMKARLGEMTVRSLRTNSKASSRRICRTFMRYARHIVAERLIPAWQWTRTRPLHLSTDSIKWQGKGENRHLVKYNLFSV